MHRLAAAHHARCARSCRLRGAHWSQRGTWRSGAPRPVEIKVVKPGTGDRVAQHLSHHVRMAEPAAKEIVVETYSAVYHSRPEDLSRTGAANRCQISVRLGAVGGAGSGVGFGGTLAPRTSLRVRRNAPPFSASSVCGSHSAALLSRPRLIPSSRRTWAGCSADPRNALYSPIICTQGGHPRTREGQPRNAGRPISAHQPAVNEGLDLVVAASVAPFRGPPRQFLG